MTFHAVLEIGNALLQMFRADIRLVVLMAAVAGVGFISSRMTGGTRRYAAFTVIHGEGVISIIGGGSPCGCGVAGSAIRAEIAYVLGWLGVTGKTGCIHSLELTVRMALLALHADMRTRQWEVRPVVVEGGVFPIVRGVTAAAVCAVFAVVFVILLMTGIAVGGCAFENVVHMALFAFCFGVFAFEFESRKVMVEFRGLPAFG